MKLLAAAAAAAAVGAALWLSAGPDSASAAGSRGPSGGGHHLSMDSHKLPNIIEAALPPHHRSTGELPRSSNRPSYRPTAAQMQRRLPDAALGTAMRRVLRAVQGLACHSLQTHGCSSICTDAPHPKRCSMPPAPQQARSTPCPLPLPSPLCYLLPLQSRGGTASSTIRGTRGRSARSGASSKGGSLWGYGGRASQQTRCLTCD